MPIMFSPLALYVDGRWQPVRPASLEEAVDKIVDILDSLHVDGRVEARFKIDETRWDTHYYFEKTNNQNAREAVVSACEAIVRDTKATRLQIIVEAPLKNSRYAHKVIELKLSAQILSDYYADTPQTTGLVEVSSEPAETLSA